MTRPADGREGTGRGRHSTRTQRRLRSLFRRFGLGLVNRSGVVFVQSVPEFMRGREADFDRLHRLWVAGHDKRRFDLSRLYLLVANAEKLERDGVPGAIAELGVWRGNSAAVLHALLPERELYLFDTFTGFDGKDLEPTEPQGHVPKFSDTSEARVRALVGDSPRVHLVKGYFPDTTEQVPPETRFAFVHLDCDLYTPMRAGLEWFHPRLAPGGMILVHDYGGGGWPGVTRACDEFSREVGLRPVILPDKAGSAMFVATART